MADSKAPESMMPLSDKDVPVLIEQPCCIIPYEQVKQSTAFEILFVENPRQENSYFLNIVWIVSVIFLILLFLSAVAAVSFLSVSVAAFGMYLYLNSQTDLQEIVVDEEGISFPVSAFYIAPQGNSYRWNELKSVSFLDEDGPSSHPTRLIVKLNDGLEAELRVDGFSRENLELLIRKLKTHCPEIEFRPPLEKLSFKVTAEDGAILADSFTSLWESEMRMRFGSTAFVPLESGDELMGGRVRILGQIAFGGLSAIYLGKLDDKEVIVVKEAVVPGSADDASADKSLQLFKREAGLLCKINHPRIARVLDYLVENGRHYLLLQYLDGINLRKFVAEHGPQPEDTVKRWAGEICAILAYLHGLHPPVIHRDLTPNNLILEKDGELSLIDFGAANTFLGTATGTVIGKPAYIPLEQFQGKAAPVSDIYALGGTLFFLLTGCDPEPFAPLSPDQAGARVSPGFNELIADASKRDRHERISDAKTFLARLEKLK